MEELNRIIAKNISDLRRAASMTQAELGERLCYSDKLISKWERGEAAPNVFALKQMSEIFGVGVEYFFSEHDGDRAVEFSAEKSNTRRFSSRAIITGISVCGIFMIATLLYVILWATVGKFSEIFVYSLPAALILVLVLNSVWNRGRHNYPIIGMLIVAVILTVYVALREYNVWQLFLLLIPGEIIVFLCALLKKK